MIRTVLILAAALLGAGPAQAQSLDGGVASGFASHFSGGFSGDVRSGFQAGFGLPDRGRRAQLGDVTLGSSGGFTAGRLRGQPSNFGRSVGAMGPIAGSTLTFDNGPEVAVDLGAGPAGPLD